MNNAYFTLDFEDLHHLDYINSSTEYSYLSGIEKYLEICENHDIAPNIFVLSDVVRFLKPFINDIKRLNGIVALHGLDHTRPLELSPKRFAADTLKSKEVVEQILGLPVLGYRASCFSMDRRRLDILIELGFDFDSSYINFVNHPLYGDIDLHGFEDDKSGIYKLDNFTVYELTTSSLFSKNIPFSGGGYMRIFPQLFLKLLLERLIITQQIINFYIHPFEFCDNIEKVPDLSPLNNFRLNYNTGLPLYKKMVVLIESCKRSNYEFKTFE